MNNYSGEKGICLVSQAHPTTEKTNISCVSVVGNVLSLSSRFVPPFCYSDSTKDISFSEY